MVKIDNNTNTEDNSDSLVNENVAQGAKRYTIDPKELTFPIEGMKHGRVVKDDNDDQNPTMKEIEQDAKLSRGEQKISKEQQQEDIKKAIESDPRIIEYKRLERLKFDENVKFVHFPDDPAYRPISLEAIKMNEFENDDLKLNTRIMMNLALGDYVIFREIPDDDDKDPIPIKVYFRRVKTNEFNEYVDIQTQLDDLVKRANLIESTYPFTLELQDKLYETQKRLIKVARDRVKKGFDIFFKWSPEERTQLQKLYEMYDNNDITFNVDTAFLRITKSPFLRRKSSPSS